MTVFWEGSQVNNEYKSKENQLKDIIKKKVTGADIKFHNFSAKELISLHQKKKFKKLDLVFKETPITSTFNEGYGYVGIVDIKDYFNFITDDNDKILENIFESNIRHYQGDVDVNKKIKESLESEFEIDFWWLNNGITIIADSAFYLNKTLSIENVQIVNGLQTTFTLEKYFNNLQNSHQRNERSILVKVIGLNSENKREIDKIIASTNSQNPVPPVLLRATDEIQRNIELHFFDEGYFYDRRKNYYKNMGKPAAKIFTIQSTAQAIQAIINKEPDTATAKPTTLIKTDESYEKIFNKKTPFEIFLKCAQINKSVRDFIKSNLPNEKKSMARMYAWYLVRSLVSILTQKGNYTKDDINSLNVDNITNKDHEKNLLILTDLVNEYKKDSTTTNDTSICKSGKFRNFINENIENKIT